MNDMERMDQTMEPQTEQVQETPAAAPEAQVPEVTPVPEAAEAPAPIADEAAAPKAQAKQPQAEEAPKHAPSFMDEVAANMTRIRNGQTVTGKVVQITDDEVCVNIGYKSDGLIKRSDLVDENIELGDDIEVEIVKVNDGEGNVILSQRNIVNRKV